MAWVKVDDGFARHPKVVAAGPLAMAMQIAALCYCNKELTDGFVPRAVARTLIDWEFVHKDNLYQVGVSGHDATCPWVIKILVDAGMWEEVEGGYRIHDFEEYQPSKETVLADRQSNADRQRRHRERNAVTNTVSNAPRNGTVTDPPYPVPVPVSRIPNQKEKQSPAVTVSRNAKLPKDWNPNDDEIAYAIDKGLTNWEDEAEKFKLYWGGNGKAMADWSLVWKRWVRTAMERKGSRASPNGHRGTLSAADFAEMARQEALTERSRT